MWSRMEILSLVGSRAWTPPRAEAPRPSFSVPLMPSLPVILPVRVAHGLRGVLSAGDPQQGVAGGRGSRRPSAPFLGLYPPSELSVQSFRASVSACSAAGTPRAPGPGWMGPELQVGRGSWQFHHLYTRCPAHMARGPTAHWASALGNLQSRQHRVPPCCPAVGDGTLSVWTGFTSFRLQTAKSFLSHPSRYHPGTISEVLGANLEVHQGWMGKSDG